MTARFASPLRLPAISFLQVRDIDAKLDAVARICTYVFLQKERLLLTVSSEAAALFIDDLLWSRPKEGFVPHCIASSPTWERVVITLKSENINQASVLFNLSPQAHALAASFSAVYELWDETEPDRLAIAQNRLNAYRKWGFPTKVLTSWP